MLEDKVKDTIKTNKLFKKGDRVIVGVSGGADSVCLLFILWRLKKELGLKLFVAHLNHGIRGRQADLDAEFVKGLADQFKLPFVVKNIKKGRIKVNLEAEAREARYSFFKEILKQKKADKIAVAHTADDQIETILMFLLRGAGLRGLSGMKYKRDKIVRPILDCFREEILKYLKKNRLKYRKDITNEDVSFSRNRIRHKLIPYLEKEFNPQIKQVLFRNSKIVREDFDFIQREIKKLIPCLFKKNGDSIILDLPKWKKLPLVLKKGVLIFVLEKYLGYIHDIGFGQLDDLINMLQKGKSGSIKQILDLRIFKDYDKILFSKKDFFLNRGLKRNIKINLPGVTEIRELKIRFKTEFTAKKEKETESFVFLDFNKIKKELFVRTRKEGDKFYPIGIQGSKKLKDFFIDNKVSRLKREMVPLIVDGNDQIVWVGGFRSDRRFKVDDQTKRILKISLFKSYEE